MSKSDGISLWGALVLVFMIVLVVAAPSCSEEVESRDAEILDSAMRKAQTGRASEMSEREIAAFRAKQLADSYAHKRTIEAKQEVARESFSEKERQIFQYMKSRWDGFAESPSGYDPTKHDELVVSEAASKFGVSKQEAQSIYRRVDGAGLDLD
jgi:hypothetical protein